MVIVHIKKTMNVHAVATSSIENMTSTEFQEAMTTGIFQLQRLRTRVACLYEV